MIYRVIRKPTYALEDLTKFHESSKGQCESIPEKIIMIRIFILEAMCIIDEKNDISSSLYCLKKAEDLIHDAIHQLENSTIFIADKSDYLVQIQKLSWITSYNIAFASYNLRDFNTTAQHLTRLVHDKFVRMHCPDSNIRGVLYYFLGLSLLRKADTRDDKELIESYLLSASSTAWLRYSTNEKLLRFTLGKLKQSQVKHNEAIEEFSRSLEIDDQNPYAFFRRAWSYKYIGDYLHAGNDFETAKILQPGDPNFCVDYRGIQTVAYMEIDTEPDLLEEIPVLFPLPGEF